MVKTHIASKGQGPFFVVLLLTLFWPLIGDTSSGSFSASDLDQADPVELTSPIMAIDYVNGTLVVAEKEVIIVDMTIGNERFTTQVTDAEDETISIESLNVGDKVLIQGLELKNGRVVGAKVQQQ